MSKEEFLKALALTRRRYCWTTKWDSGQLRGWRFSESSDCWRYALPLAAVAEEAGKGVFDSNQDGDRAAGKALGLAADLVDRISGAGWCGPEGIMNPELRNMEAYHQLRAELINATNAIDSYGERDIA